MDFSTYGAAWTRPCELNGLRSLILGTFAATVVLVVETTANVAIATNSWNARLAVAVPVH